MAVVGVVVVEGMGEARLSDHSHGRRGLSTTAAGAVPKARRARHRDGESLTDPQAARCRARERPATPVLARREIFRLPWGT